MDNLLNIKCTWRHCTLEYLIKKNDTSSHDLTRAAVFKREVKAGETVKDWKSIRMMLAVLKQEDSAPVFTNLQAKYDEETAESLKKIRDQMLSDLREVGIQVLQTQYMVLLLQANYLQTLKHEKLALSPLSGEKIEERDVNLPEIFKLLAELVLSDKNSNELRQIRTILVDWKNKNCNIDTETK